MTLEQTVSSLAAHMRKGILAAALAIGACGTEYKTVDSCISIDEIHADAVRRDNQNLNDEYVVFSNACTTPLSLAGWSIEDADGNRYAFPQRELPSGQEVCLRSGSGVDSAHNVYWRSNGRPIWNNDKDTVYVFDNTGALVVEESYDFRERK